MAPTKKLATLLLSLIGSRPCCVATVFGLAFMVCGFVTTTQVVAQSIWTNPITGTNPNTSNPYTTGQTVNTNIAVSGIGRGSGITGSNANDRYNATGWNSTSFDATDFFYFTLTPNAGFEINFTNFVYTGQTSGSGPTSFAFRSSIDSFSGNIGTPNSTGTTISLSGSSYQNITSAITFRIFGWGASAAGGTFSINDFTFNGSVSSIAASNRYWDTNGATSGIGGSDTWSSTSTNWSSALAGNVATGVQAVTSNLVFGGTAGTVTVSGTVAPEAGMSFDTSGYNLTGGTVNLAGANATANTITTATGVTATIGSDLSGSAGMTKAGAGTLVLTGTKSYSGGTTISAGTLQLGDGTTDGNLSAGSAITNNSVLSVNNTSNQAISGNITGTGSLVKTGVGNLTLSGSNSYGGGTTVSAGILTGTTSSLQGAITNNADVVIDQGTNGTYAGAMSGTGALTKSGSGNVTLSGTNSYSGGTTVSAGTLTGTTASLQGAITNNASVVIDQTSSGTYADNMTGSGSLTKSGTGNVTLSGANSYSGGTTVAGGTLTGNSTSLQGNITNNSNVVFNQASDGTYTGNMTGSGVLTKSGTGTLTVNGNNSHSGGSLISSGTVVVGSDTAMGTGVVNAVGANVAVLAANGVTVGNNIVLNGQSSSAFSATYNFGTTSGAATPSSTTGSGFTAGSVSRGNNNGTLNALLSSTSASSGYTAASGEFNAGAASRAGSLNTASDGSAYFEFSVTPGSGNAISLGELRFGSRSTSTGPQAYSLRSNLDGFAADIASGSLSNNSIWALNTASSVAAAGGVDSPITFRLYGHSGTGTPTADVTNWRIDDLFYNGSVLTSGFASIGTAEPGASATFNGSVSISNTARFTAASGGTSTFGGVVQGTGNVEKTGSGSVVLNATNTYTGNTTVSQGSLIISSGGAINSPAATVAVNGGELQVNGSVTAATVSVASGANLSGSGSISGAVSIASGANLSPGNSPGTLTVNGDLTMNGNYNWEVASLGSADLVDVNGILTLSGATLSISGPSLSSGKFTLFAYNNSTALTGGFIGWVNGGTVGNWMINYGDTLAGSNGGTGNFFITVTAIPEPASLLLVGLALASGLTGRRRRRTI